MAGGLEDGEASYDHNDLRRKKLRGDFQGVRWCGRDLSCADACGADLSGACLVGANLYHAQLSGANLCRANLTEARLDGTDFAGANLSGADLRHIDLSPARTLRGADLRKAKLQGADLVGVDLGCAKLMEADLSGANLTSANLRDADLTGATLRGADLGEADLTDASLRNADLCDAKLLDVKGLRADQLAGADLCGAELPPDVARFESLAHAAETAKNARTVFLMILLGCAYSVLTIGATTDVQLLTNAATSSLPIIGTEVPIEWFYRVAPVVLFGFYVYFHLYLQNMWRTLAALPARFPDGKALDERTYPWLLCRLVRAHVAKFRDRPRPPLSNFQCFASVALAWGAVPSTLLLFWLRYLPAHAWPGTLLHIALLASSLALGIYFYRLARATLRGSQERVIIGHSVPEVMCLPVFVVLLLASHHAIGWPVILAPDGSPSQSTATALNAEDLCLSLLIYRECADFTEADVSTKPAGWREPRQGRALSGADEENVGDDVNKDLIEEMRGASLKGRNLRWAAARDAFLVRADLREADLSGAYLLRADLREANLRGARLHRADLTLADLRGAYLSEVQLDGADLTGAKVDQAIFAVPRVDLTSVDLRNAQLQGAKLQRIRLTKAKLSSADLTQANLSAANLTEANLSNADLTNADLTHADLRFADLTGAKIERANFTNADLLGTNLSDVDLTEARELTDDQLHLACGDEMEVAGERRLAPCPDPNFTP